MLVLEKRRAIGVPVQCGEFVPEVQELKEMLPSAKGLDDIFEIPPSLKARATEEIVLISPKGREFRFAFSGYSTWRDRFDAHLANMSRKEGAELRTDAGARGIIFEGGRSKGVELARDGEKIEATVFVGADGPDSIVARGAGFTGQVLTPAVTCSIPGSFDDEVRMYFGSMAPGGYAWVIPKNDAANVGVGAQTKNAKRKNINTMLRDFLRHMELEEGASAPIGKHVPIDGPRRETVRSNVLLVGDAAGHVMATNGGGVPIAMICGRIAGKVISDHLEGKCALVEYDREWRRQVGRELETARKVKRLADRFAFGSDRAMELCMRILGKRGLERAIKCRRLFL